MTTADILNLAAKVLETMSWSQGATARDGNGRHCDAYDRYCVAVDVWGAVERATTPAMHKERALAENVLLATFPQKGLDVATINDKRIRDKDTAVTWLRAAAVNA